MSRRKQRDPLATVNALLGAAGGLAEALLILCDDDLPRAERHAALRESRWYMQWLKDSGMHVELKDAEGVGVALSRDALPGKAIASITLRSVHVVTFSMVESLRAKGDETGAQALLARHTALGAATITLPVLEPRADC